MDSTNSSPSSNFALRFSGVGKGSAGERIVLPLYRSAEELAGAPQVCEGHVSESGCYRVSFLFLKDGVWKNAFRLVLVVNGESMGFVRRSQSVATTLLGARSYRYFDVEPEREHLRPFGLVSGYARCDIELYDQAGALLGRFLAPDIACQLENEVDAASVCAMVSELLDSPNGNLAREWMLGGGDAYSRDDFSLAEGGYERNLSRSLLTYLRVVEDGLLFVERAIPLLRSHAVHRVNPQAVMVDARHAHRFGAAEMQWLARHPEHLLASPDGPVQTPQGRYDVMRVESVRTMRDEDVYENRLILGFATTVARDLETLKSSAGANLDRLLNRKTAGDTDPARMLTMVAARFIEEREHYALARIDTLQHRAAKVLRVLQQVLKGVRTMPLGSMRMMRTKVFQEVREYSELYAVIEKYRWFGESLLFSDGLSVETLKLDRFYETYVLFRLLCQLSSMGFRPAGMGPYAGKYDYASRYFSDGCHVANVYPLAKGSQTVTLYYEPVVFSDERAKHGMSLHRLSRKADAVYTPDFVLVFQDGPARKVIVLDAKYRPRRNVTHCFDDGCEFDRAVEKYLYRMVDAKTGRIPDAVWLLSGVCDDDDEAWLVRALPWAHAFAGEPMPSGVEKVVPGRSLAALFGMMGIGAPCGEKGRWIDPGSAPEPVAQTPQHEAAHVDAPLRRGEHRFVEPPDLRPDAEVPVEPPADVGSVPAPVEQPADAGSVPAPVEQPRKTSSAPMPVKQSVGVASAPASVEQPADMADALPDGPVAYEEEVEIGLRDASLYLVSTCPEEDDDAQVTAAENLEANPQSASEPKRKKKRKAEEKKRKAEEKAKKAEAKQAKEAAKREKKAKKKALEADVALKPAEAVAGSKAAEAGKQSAAKAKPKSQASNTRRQAEGVEDVISQIVAGYVGNAEDLYNANWCRTNLGIDKPLLRKTATKGYMKLDDCEPPTYCLRIIRPDYANKLKAYAKRMKGKR